MTPDPRWLEILKASGWQTAAVATACGSFLLVGAWGWLPPLAPWMIQLAAFGFLLCASLAVVSFISAMLKFFPIRVWVVHWISLRRATRGMRDYIPYMTSDERAIIAYLLEKNEKTFCAAADGGKARILLSRGIVTIVAQPGQQLDSEDVPMTIPDHLWDVLRKHKNEFPYTPVEDDDGVEIHPWRVHWMERRI
jgi:hypothetical protein